MAGMVTSVGIGGPWQSGKEENNDNSRRTQNMKSKKSPAKKKRYPKKK